MKNLNKTALLLAVCWSAVLGLSGCSSGNLDYVKERGPEKFREIGFEPVGYEGYQWGFWGLNSYGGAKVWWRLRKTDDNGISYTGYIQRWGMSCTSTDRRRLMPLRPNVELYGERSESEPTQG